MTSVNPEPEPQKPALLRGRNAKRGCSRKLSDAEIEAALKLISGTDKTMADIAEQFGVSRRTLYNAINRYQKEKAA